MRHYYKDILHRIPDDPKWWDEYAVPRFDAFSPRDCANIYAREICLLLIECQGCRHEFHVCLSRSAWETIDTTISLATLVVDHDVHYGDPPNIECCPAGPTMNSVTRRVLEFWRHPVGEWERAHDLEIEIDCEWMQPETDAVEG